MDDLTVLVSYIYGCIHSKSNALLLVHSLLGYYDENLELEPQHCDVPNQSTYLESYIHYGHPPLHISAYNKNVPYIYEHQAQKFLKIQHFHSYTPVAVKRAVLISTLHRLQRNCMHTDDLLAAVLHLYAELSMLDYSKPFLLKALYHMFRSTGSHTWLRIIERLSSV